MKLLIFFALVIASQASWTSITTLLTRNPKIDCKTSSIYVDPTNDISHILFVDTFNNIYFYFAVSPNGKALYQANFTDPEYAWKGIIKGSGDGQHIYMALQMTRSVDNKYYSDIKFTESSDGGKTWSELITIPHKEKNDAISRFIGDMAYVEETDSLYIIYGLIEKSEIGMVMRKGHMEFVPETIIIDNAKLGHNLGFTYTIDANKKITLNLFFISSSSLYYSNSQDDGKTWITPKLVTSKVEDFLLGGIGNKAITENLFAVFQPIRTDPHQFVATKDMGKTFTNPKDLISTNAIKGNREIGLAVCGTTSTPLLIAFVFGVDYNRNTLTYIWWDADKMVSKGKHSHPFEDYSVNSIAVACQTDDWHENVNITVAFTGTTYGSQKMLAFTREINKVASQ